MPIDPTTSRSAATVLSPAAANPALPTPGPPTQPGAGASASLSAPAGLAPSGRTSAATAGRHGTVPAHRAHGAAPTAGQAATPGTVPADADRARARELVMSILADHGLLTPSQALARGLAPPGSASAPSLGPAKAPGSASSAVPKGPPTRGEAPAFARLGDEPAPPGALMRAAAELDERADLPALERRRTVLQTQLREGLEGQLRSVDQRRAALAARPGTTNAAELALLAKERRTCVSGLVTVLDDQLHAIDTEMQAIAARGMPTAGSANDQRLRALTNHRAALHNERTQIQQGSAAPPDTTGRPAIPAATIAAMQTELPTIRDKIAHAPAFAMRREAHERKACDAAQNVRTPQGDGFGVRNGRLHVWNNATARWSPGGAADQVRLGADGNAYLRDGRRIERLASDGSRTPCANLPAAHGTPLDFAVLPGGSSLTLTRTNGPLREARLTLHAGGADPMPLPLPPGAGVPKSVAAGPDGQVYLLDADGQAWRGRSGAIQAGAEGWRRLDLPEHTRFVQFSTQPDGSIGALARRAEPSGQETKFALTDRHWEPEEARTPMLDRAYGPLRDATTASMSHVTLGTVITPGTARTSQASPAGEGASGVTEFLRRKLDMFHATPAIAVPGGPSAEPPSLGSRWNNYFRSHYGSPTPQGANNAGVREFLEIGSRHLRSPNPVTIQHDNPTRAALAAQLAPKVVSNAGLALDRIEATLGTTGRDRAGAASEGNPLQADYQQFTANQPVRDDSNALHQLCEQADLLFRNFPPGSDERRLVDRLVTMRDDLQLHFPVNQWPSATQLAGRTAAAVGWNAQASLGDNPAHDFCSMQLRKIAHDLQSAFAAVSAVEQRAQQGARSTDPAHQARTKQVVDGMIHDACDGLDDPQRGSVNTHFQAYQRASDYSDRIDPDLLDKTLRRDAEQLLQRPSGGVWSAQRMRAAAEVDGGALLGKFADNADAATARLLDGLGLSAAYAQHAQNQGAPAAAAGPARQRALSNDNVLYQIYQRRLATLHGLDTDPLAAAGGQAPPASSAYGTAGDARSREVTAKLAFMLHQGKFLPAVPGEESNPLSLLTGKLVHDQLALEATVDGIVGKAPQGAAPATPRRLDEGPVSRLFDLGLVDASAHRLLVKLERQKRVASHPDHVAQRALRFQGALGSAADQERFYLKAFHELKPGDAIKLKYGWNVGVDGDGMGLVVRLTDRQKQGLPEHQDPKKNKLNVPLNIIPNLQPMVSASGGKEHGLEIRKTGDGVDITLGDVNDGELKAAIKLMWGAGRYGANEKLNPDGSVKSKADAVGVGFLGIEVIPGVRVSSKATGELTFSIKNDDSGNAAFLSQQIISGKTLPTDLLDAALVLSQKESQTFTAGGDLAAHALGAAVGIFFQKMSPEHRFKMVGAPLLQLAASAEVSKTRERSQGGGAVTLTDGDAKTSANLNLNQINIAEIQHSYIQAGNSHLGTKPRIGDRFEVENKVPVWIDVHSWPLWKTSSEPPRVTSRPDGTVQSVHLGRTVGADAADIQVYLEALAGKSPDAHAALQGLLANASAEGRAVSLTMELTPSALARLQQPATRADPALQRQLFEREDSWRIQSASVRAERPYETAMLLGLNVLRFVSKASNTLSEGLGSVDLQYPAGEAPTASARGRLSPGGGMPRFEDLH